MNCNKVKHAVLYVLHDRNQLKDSVVTHFFKWLPDKPYTALRFRCKMGYWMDFNNPKTFNEKLNWLKIYDHNPLYTQMVDKYSVKSYVSDIIGSEYVIPTLGIWNSPENIDFDALPQQFVLKTTHGGGNVGVIICKDKEQFDKKKVVSRLQAAMKQNLYKDSREWPYKNVAKRIIAEPYIEDNISGELRDYKFFCFDGQVKALFVATERQKREEPFFNFFDDNYTSLPIKQGHPVSSHIPDKPSRFDEMKDIASKLSKGLPCVRVDLYEANGKVLFGELTFYHFGGIVPFEPREWDDLWGTWLKLPIL